ncbi:MAG: hypothetical protein ACRCZI_05405 [Cetobacterium sp.]
MRLITLNGGVYMWTERTEPTDGKPVDAILWVILGVALTALLLVSTEVRAEYRGNPSIPDYGSAAHERRMYQDKNYEGDRHGTPYTPPSSNYQRYQEPQRTDSVQPTYRNPYDAGQSNPYSLDHNNPYSSKRQGY